MLTGGELPDEGACLSADRMYRYWLGRAVDTSSASEQRRLLFVMLNPSTADESANDPTIRKLLSYARAWGYARLDVVNLFAYRSPSPDELSRRYTQGVDIVGPENAQYIELAALRAHKVIVAWGGRVPSKLKVSRPAAVLAQLKTLGAGRWVPEYLELSKDGTPKHPLYLLGALLPQPFER